MDNFEEELLMGNYSAESNVTENYINLPTIYYIWHALSIVTHFIGSACDSLIIHAIITNRQMRSRTNKIILNWALCDLSYLVLTLMVETYSIYVESLHSSFLWECILWHVDVMLRFLGFLFIGTLLSNRLIRSKRVSDRVIFGVLWTLAIALILLNTHLCHFHHYVHLLYWSTYLLCLAALVVLTSKEINAYRKQRDNNPISARTKYRMTVAAIYIYNWFFAWFFGAIADIFYRFILHYLQIFYLSGSLSSLYMLIYIAKNDRHFKYYIDGKFGRNCDADTNVDFTEYCAEDECDDAGVGATVGEDGKTIKRLRE